MAKPLDQLSRAELDELGFGRHGVEDIEHSWFTLPGGERLALRIWAPSGTIQDEVGVRRGLLLRRNYISAGWCAHPGRGARPGGGAALRAGVSALQEGGLDRGEGPQEAPLARQPRVGARAWSLHSY